MKLDSSLHDQSASRQCNRARRLHNSWHSLHFCMTFWGYTTGKGGMRPKWNNTAKNALTQKHKRNKEWRRRALSTPVAHIIVVQLLRTMRMLQLQFKGIMRVNLPQMWIMWKIENCKLIILRIRRTAGDTFKFRTTQRENWTLVNARAKLVTFQTLYGECSQPTKHRAHMLKPTFMLQRMSFEQCVWGITE